MQHLQATSTVRLGRSSASVNPLNIHAEVRDQAIAIRKFCHSLKFWVKLCHLVSITNTVTWLGKNLYIKSIFSSIHLEHLLRYGSYYKM